MKRACLDCGRIISGGRRRCAACSTTPERKGSTRQWRATRERILERDGHRCCALVDGERCPVRTGLHVDHIEPVSRNPGKVYPDSELVTLCQHHNLSKGSR